MLNPGIDQLFKKLLTSDQKRYAFEDLLAEMIKREEEQNQRLRNSVGNLPGFPWHKLPE
tara:strand:+ start:845 stop:1021 length:177 start_codon:yes stop_codon:yes gene_type:complete